MDIRVGIGYDIHRLSPERKLIIGGVTIPHHSGLAGHSDADVLLHAICEAFLGAISLGNIGTHFPNTDPQYKGISSIVLLEKVNNLIRDKGYEVVNIDSTIIAESPKLMPYAEEMRKNIATCLDCRVDQVAVKATTAEGLGDIGKGEGISANAVVLVQKV